MTTPSTKVSDIVTYFTPDQEGCAAIVIDVTPAGATLRLFRRNGTEGVVADQAEASWFKLPSGDYEFQGGWSHSATPPAEPAAPPVPEPAPAP